MKVSEMNIFLIFLCTFNLYFVNCDLPVHCKIRDIVGLWAFKATELIQSKLMSCGHHSPGDLTANLASSNVSFTVEYIIELNVENIAILRTKTELFSNNSKTIGSKGTWTMLYNQGIYLEFPGLNFLTFSYYNIEQKGKEVIKHSKCYQTCLGWYSDGNAFNAKRGCFKGLKLGVNIDLTTFFVIEMNHIEVSNSNSYSNGINLNQSLPIENIGTTKLKIIGNSRETTSLGVRVIHKIPTPIENINTSKVSSIRVANLSHQIPTPVLAKPIHINKKHNSVFLNKFGVMQHAKPQTTYLHNNFAQSLNLSVHRFKESNNIKETDFINVVPNTNSNIQKVHINSFELSSDTLEDISMFPKMFDWKHIVRPASSQGKCGSCYVITTLKMVEARLKIIYNHDVSLSVENVLKCSFFTQGCDGGVPFSVMKYGYDFELLPDFCYKINDHEVGLHATCKNNCTELNLKYTYKFLNFYYVGGAYGRCSEKLMLQELYFNGPFVVSFNPDDSPDFMNYKEGVYSNNRHPSWVLRGSKKPSFVKITHSVLLVGWGEEENIKTGVLEKYWLVQNTWGTNWGEDGYFKIKRGIDELGIESSCEAGTPVIVDNLTKINLTPKQYKDDVAIKIKIPKVKANLND